MHTHMFSLFNVSLEEDFSCPTLLTILFIHSASEKVIPQTSCCGSRPIASCLPFGKVGKIVQRTVVGIVGRDDRIVRPADSALLLFRSSVVADTVTPWTACIKSGFPVLHRLLEPAQTHVH